MRVSPKSLYLVYHIKIGLLIIDLIFDVLFCKDLFKVPYYKTSAVDKLSFVKKKPAEKEESFLES